MVGSKQAGAAKDHVPGTRMANYVKENRLRLQSASELITSYHEGKGLEFRAELTKMLKQ
jgi:hypothetical protein